MTTVNVKRKKSLKIERNQAKTAEVATPNFMGGVSFVPTPLTRLQMMAGSCFFGEPQYYIDGETRPKSASTFGGGGFNRFTHHFSSQLENTLGSAWALEFAWPSGAGTDSSAKRLEAVIDASLDFDAEATLQEAARLRNEDNIRVTPQVILVRAAIHPKVKGTPLVRKYAASIVKRGDEPSVGLAYYLSLATSDSKKIPNSLKKVWAEFLSNQSEYSLAKYRMESRTVKTVDVINLVHAHSPAINSLMKGTLTMTDRSWEAITSEGGGTPESWAKALPLLLNPKGHQALLRNLRNLYTAKLMSPEVLTALKNGVADGKQLPFRYYSAYLALADIFQFAKDASPIQDALAECLDASVAHLPKFPGRVMSLCDNSGSAQGALTSDLGTMRVSSIGNLLGLVTGKQADDGYVGLFGDTLKVIPVRKTDSTLTQLANLDKVAQTVGTSTENGVWLFFDNAIRNKEVWDHIFVYSDMQAGHGGLYGIDSSEYSKFQWNDSDYLDVAALVSAYRKKVNPNVMVYLVQVAGYDNTLIPEFYDRTFILGGWSDSVLRFAGAMGAVYAPAQ